MIIIIIIIIINAIVTYNFFWTVSYQDSFILGFQETVWLLGGGFSVRII